MELFAETMGWGQGKNVTGTPYNTQLSHGAPASGCSGQSHLVLLHPQGVGTFSFHRLGTWTLEMAGNLQGLKGTQTQATRLGLLPGRWRFQDT